MEVKVEVVPNTKTMTGLKQIPDRVLWNVARQTLDMSRDTGIIPMSPPGTKTRGKLRTTSMAFGVQKIGNGYCIGSITDYASYVWKMPDSTNWTDKNSNNKWYTRTLKKHGKTITEIAINRGWRDVM